MRNTSIVPQHKNLFKISLKIIGLLLFGLLVFDNSRACAFLYNVTVLEEKAIGKLSDEVLIDNYIEVTIELAASTLFHQTSGFSPRGYEKYKGLLRYRVDLLGEMKERNLEIPKVELQE